MFTRNIEIRYEHSICDDTKQLIQLQRKELSCVECNEIPKHIKYKRLRMADMSDFLKKQTTALTEYDEQLDRRLIEKVTIYEDKFNVEFKSGVKVDIEG